MDEPNTSHIAGSCYCGAVTFEFSAPASVIHCHCGQCRRLSGAAFTTWGSVRKQSFKVTGAGGLSAFAATQNVTRYFCKTCGPHAYTSDDRYQKIVGVPAGILGAELPSQPKSHYFVSHKAAWHAINDALPQFGEDSGFGQMHL